MPSYMPLYEQTRQRVFQINTGCHRNVHFPGEDGEAPGLDPHTYTLYSLCLGLIK